MKASNAEEEWDLNEDDDEAADSVEELAAGHGDWAGKGPHTSKRY
jgi:hypothetical protein